MQILVVEGQGGPPEESNKQDLKNSNRAIRITAANRLAVSSPSQKTDLESLLISTRSQMLMQSALFQDER